MKKTALKKKLALGRESIRLLNDPGPAVGGMSAQMDTICTQNDTVIITWQEAILRLV